MKLLWQRAAQPGRRVTAGADDAPPLLKIKSGTGGST
jgi:hypothetical protein